MTTQTNMTTNKIEEKFATWQGIIHKTIKETIPTKKKKNGKKTTQISTITQ